MLSVRNKKVGIFMFKAVIVLLIASCVRCSDIRAQGIDARPSADSNAPSDDIKAYNWDGKEAGYVVLHPPSPCFPSNPNPNPNDEDEMGWELRQYTLTDSAENSLVLTLNYKKEGKEVTVEVLCIQYNGGAIKEVPKNKMQVEFSINENGVLKKLEQKIKVKDAFDAMAKYSAKKNQTGITVKYPTDPEILREIRTGLVILEMLTDEGGLSYQFNEQ